MQNVTYNLRDLRKNKKKTEFSCQQMHRTLDSVGNNLMGMLWMMHLSLAALQEPPDIDQAKENLQEALRAGDCAKKLMRTVLNAPKLICNDKELSLQPSNRDQIKSDLQR